MCACIFFESVHFSPSSLSWHLVKPPPDFIKQPLTWSLHFKLWTPSKAANHLFGMQVRCHLTAPKLLLLLPIVLRIKFKILNLSSFIKAKLIHIVRSQDSGHTRWTTRGREADFSAAGNALFLNLDASYTVHVSQFQFVKNVN